MSYKKQFLSLSQLLGYGLVEIRGIYIEALDPVPRLNFCN